MNEASVTPLFHARARGDWVRLRTLVTLRWIAIAGQAGAVLIASKVLGFALPLTLCVLVISASVCFNVIAHLMNPSERRVSEQGTLWSLFFDLAQLVGLLMLTGGLNNPFALLILAPVTIAATALRQRSTFWLGLAALASVPMMSFVHIPLHLADGTALQVPEVFRHGIAAAIVIGMLFLGLYARRVTAESFAMSEALNATQVALAREQRLAAIGGMAAAAAHELGTPLATIKLVAGELERELEDNPDLAEDVALIRREVERCGAIMADLGKGGRDDSHVKLAPISAVVEEAARPHLGRGTNILTRINGVENDVSGEPQPTVRRSPEIIHGLRNLIQNAVDFARTTVWIDIEFGADELTIAIGDDGQGFAPDILPRLGEPYVSSRARGDRRTANDGYDGMGLGVFIARTLLERTGASISFANGSDPRERRSTAQTPASVSRPSGAVIELSWPIEVMAVERSDERRALGKNSRFTL